MTGLPQCPHCMAELPDESIAANRARRRTIRQLQRLLAEERRIHDRQIRSLSALIQAERGQHAQTGAEWAAWRDRAIAAEAQLRALRGDS